MLIFCGVYVTRIICLYKPTCLRANTPQALAAALAENDSVSYIDLGCNQLGDEEVEAGFKRVLGFHEGGMQHRAEPFGLEPSGL